MLVRYFIVFLVSMAPFIEVRGALNIACDLGLNNYIALIIGILGNIIIIPIIYILIRKLLEWGREKKVIGKFFNMILLKGDKIGKKLYRRIGRLVYLLLFLITITPFLGGWLSTLIVSVFNYNFKKSFMVILLGIFITSLLLLFFSIGFLEVIF